MFARLKEKEGMLNWVKPKKNKKEKRTQRNKEDTVEMKARCRFYEGGRECP